MIQFPADFGFAVKAVEENGFALGFRVGNLDCDLPAGPGVDGAEDGSHSAHADEFFEEVMVQPITGVQWRHDSRVRAGPLESRKKGIGKLCRFGSKTRSAREMWNPARYSSYY